MNDLVIYLLIYHPLLFMFLWSYYRTITQRLMGPTSEVKSMFRKEKKTILNVSSMLVMAKVNVLHWHKR